MATLENRRAHWRVNLRLIVGLLCVWAFVSFGCSIFFVDQLDRIKIGGFGLGFWMAQQGSIYVFVALIAIYAWRMRRIDRQYHVHED
jgi:putative solute:sodium symporter small subunit